MKLADLIERTGIDTYDYLVRDADIPTLTGLQSQGDLLVRPVQEVADAAEPKAVPRTGIVVLEGQHPHALIGDPGVKWAPMRDPRDRLLLGYVIVPKGKTAWLHHPQHGGTGIGAGTYQLRRKRELREEERLVQD